MAKGTVAHEELWNEWRRFLDIPFPRGAWEADFEDWTSVVLFDSTNAGLITRILAGQGRGDLPLPLEYDDALESAIRAAEAGPLLDYMLTWKRIIALAHKSDG